MEKQLFTIVYIDEKGSFHCEVHTADIAKILLNKNNMIGYIVFKGLPPIAAIKNVVHFRNGSLLYKY